MSDGPPPRILERVLGRLLGGGASTPYIIGDLREEFHRRRSRGSRAGTIVWYLVEGIRIAARLRLARGSPGSTRDVPVAASVHECRRGDGLRTELRQAVRLLGRRPLLASAVGSTVALAVAASTTVFGVVDGVLLEPLPYASPERLVAVWEWNERGGAPTVVSPANFLAWREEMESFGAVGSLLATGGTMIEDGGAEPVGLMRASATYFDVVGAEPLVGRLYGEREDRPGSAPVAVLSEGFWARRFGADPNVVGRTIELGLQPGGSSFTIVGVLDDRFDFELDEAAFGELDRHDVWLPPRFGEAALESGGRELQVVARLAPGVTLEAARQEAAGEAARLAESFPDRQEGWGIRVAPLRADVVGEVRPALVAVFAGVSFLLLIACANVANLLMARAIERRPEMLVRSALGAGRWRLVRQLFVESALLSGIGGLLGVILSVAAMRAVVRAAPDIPRLDQVGVDGTVLGFALLVTCGSALLFGLAPALSLDRVAHGGRLGARRTTSRGPTRRLRSILVVAQVALSMVLLVGAGVLGRSLANRLDVELGFRAERILTAGIQMQGAGYADADASRLFEELVSRIDRLPDVSDASAIGGLPLSSAGWRTRFWPLDGSASGPDEPVPADVRGVHRDYHRVMGIPLLAGRTFGESDRADGPTVVVASRAAAERFWPEGSPIGERIAMRWGDTLRAEVVGVVGDVRDRGPEAEPTPMFYWDHRQFNPETHVSLVVRTAANPSTSVVEAIRDEVRELDPNLALQRVRPMEELIADASHRPRVATLALGLFAVGALLLSALGLYGVVAHGTAGRTGEIGVRMALGADRSTILTMVLREGSTRLLVALALGSVGAFVFVRLLGGLIFGVSPYDPLTFVATAGLLTATSLLATWLPARRASAIDPARTIRND